VRARFIGHAGATTTVELPPGSLAFSYCGVPIVYREGDIAAIELEHMDGHREVVVGAQLDRQTSLAIFQRRAPYRHLTVVVPRGSFHE
jgi:hypothetical protein